MSWQERERKALTLVKINVQRDNLENTKREIQGQRGVMVDVFNSLIPIFEEQLTIMQETLELIET